MVPKPQFDRMKPRMRRLRLEAQHIAIRHMVGDGQQATHQAAGVFKVEVLAARQLRHRLGHVALQAVGGSNTGHCDNSQRGSKQTQAVECLHSLVRGGVGVGILAHATMRRIRVFVLKPAAAHLGRKFPIGVVRRLRLPGREAESIDGRIAVADGAQRVLHRGLAAVIDALRNEQNRAAVAGRLPAQQVH